MKYGNRLIGWAMGASVKKGGIEVLLRPPTLCDALIRIYRDSVNFAQIILSADEWAEMVEQIAILRIVGEPACRSLTVRNATLHAEINELAEALDIPIVEGFSDPRPIKDRMLDRIRGLRSAEKGDFE